jgi:hypothetical protein
VRAAGDDSAIGKSTPAHCSQTWRESMLYGRNSRS